MSFRDTYASSVHDQFAYHATREGVNATVPLTVVAASIAGVDLQAWVYMAALAYTVMQAGFLGWKWHREWKTGRKSPD